MLVFLDIDGVMVPAKSWESPKLLADGFAEFSNKAVSVLQHVLAADDIIMLTTSHKTRFSLDEWKCIFKERGIPVNHIGRIDESQFGTSRKDELVNWFNLNPIGQNFIIIDDDTSLNDLPEYLKAHLILTSSMIGLTENHLVEIEAIIKHKVAVAVC